MERLFSPCNRLHDIIESQGRRGPHGRRLQELNLDLSTEALLSAERAFTHADLYAVLGNEETLAWLTPHAFVVRAGLGMLYYTLNLLRMRSFHFTADGKDIIVFALSPEHLLEICDVLFRLLAASVVDSVILRSGIHHDGGAWINAPTLAHLMEQCKSLKVLTLMNQELDENHCRVLGAYSRPDLEIVLFGCTLRSAGTSAFAEVLERNQGPTELDYCEIDYSFLADGLRGNSRLKRLRPNTAIRLREDDNRQVLAIAGFLRENKSLVELNFYNEIRVSDETWGAICVSLKTHPTLEVLKLPSAHNNATAITSRIQALLKMMKSNLSIQKIYLSEQYRGHELFRRSVIPYLETNRLRPRLLAIQKTRPIAYRAKVLGRALLAVRTDPNRFWMLLAGNAEVAFPSRTTTIAAAANIPTPTAATATTTSTAMFAAIMASVMSTLTTTATGSLPAAAVATATRAAIPTTASDAFASTPAVAAATAANVTTPSVGQKRKASP
jgi:hypothetical protein